MVFAEPLLDAAVFAPERPVVLVFRIGTSFNCSDEGAAVRAHAAVGKVGSVSTCEMDTGDPCRFSALDVETGELAGEHRRAVEAVQEDPVICGEPLELVCGGGVWVGLSYEYSVAAVYKWARR